MEANSINFDGTLILRAALSGNIAQEDKNTFIIFLSALSLESVTNANNFLFLAKNSNASLETKIILFAKAICTEN